MGDETRAAAERFDAWSFVRDAITRGTTIEQDSRAMARGYEAHSARVDAAARELADKLRPHLAETDPTPVTEAGLRAAGFWGRGQTELVSPPERGHRDAGNRRPWRLIYDADPLPGCGAWSVSFPGCEAGLGYDLPTMGHVRRVAKALGIELKEGA